MKISTIDVFVQRAKLIGLLMAISAVFYIGSRLFYVVGN
jgi:hypothetical protein